jgi:hypothetical protein
MIDRETKLENELWRELQAQANQDLGYEFWIRPWLEEHCLGKWHRGTDGKIQFDDERDRIMFLLRWGS